MGFGSKNKDKKNNESQDLPGGSGTQQAVEPADAPEGGSDTPEEFPDSSKDEKKALPLKKVKRKSFRRGAITGIIGTVVVLIAAAAVISMIGGGYKAGSGGFLSSTESVKLNTIANYIQNYYYEDVDEDAMKEALYASLFEGLDEYSQYFTEEEYQAFYEDVLSDSFAGIGAVLSQDTETMAVTVKEVYEDSPAEKAGMQAGDQLLQADDYVAEEMELDDFVTKIRGEEGSEVTVTFYRESTDETFTETVTREIIDVATVEGQMLSDGIGYLQLESFSDDTGTEFSDTIEALEKEGMEKIIIDLRGNGGGTLTAAIECLDRVVGEGLLVYTIDKNEEKQEYYATSEEELAIPIVLLTDGSTASAAEIFAGALMDYDMATVIGTTTYGKGVVQSVVELTDGSAIKLTTSSYYTPDGICIQGTGLDPDIELEYKFLGDEDDAYSIEYDNQIKRAVNYLKNH